HMPYATALTLTADRTLDTTLSQNAMRFHGRIAVDADYNGLALDASEGERIAHAMQGADIAFLGNHGVVVCGERLDYAYDDLFFLERACNAQVLAQSTGRPLAPADPAIAAKVAAQIQSERLQSELFFIALRRQLPDTGSRCRASRRHGGHSNPGYCMTPGTVRSEHRLDNRTARRRGFHTKTKPHRREPMGFCGIKA
uniref:class II aldolase/adducin family protein n=1 Tax=Streptomyces virginiae TaxID=1961 RepID=UPI0035E1D1AA